MDSKELDILLAEGFHPCYNCGKYYQKRELQPVVLGFLFKESRDYCPSCHDSFVNNKCEHCKKSFPNETDTRDLTKSEIKTYFNEDKKRAVCCIECLDLLISIYKSKEKAENYSADDNDSKCPWAEMHEGGVFIDPDEFDDGDEYMGDFLS